MSAPTSGCRTCVPKPWASVSCFAIDPRTPTSGSKTLQPGFCPSAEGSNRRLDARPGPAGGPGERFRPPLTTVRWPGLQTEGPYRQNRAEVLRVEALARDGCDLRSAGAGRRNRPPRRPRHLVGIDGSAYRRPGAKFLVEENGDTTGSVSGGCLESDVRAYALEAIKTGKSRLLRYETGSDEETVWGMGLGCEGTVEVFVQRAGA